MDRILGRVSWLCLLSLVTLTPLVHWTRSDDTVRTVQWVFLWVMVCAGCGAGLAGGFPGGLRGMPLRVPMLIFLAAFLLLPLAAFRPATAMEDSLCWVCGIGAAVLGAVWLRSRSLARRLAFGLVAANVLVAVYGLMQYAGLDWYRWAYQYGGRRPFSTLGNPNFLGGHFVLLLPWAAALFLSSSRAMTKAAALGLSLMWALVIFVTQTRSAWLGAALALFWLGWRYFREEPGQMEAQRKWLTALAVALLVSGGLALGRNAELTARVASLTKPEFGQVAKRYAAWQAAFRMWRDDPIFGIGLGCFKHGYGRHLARSMPLTEEKQFIHTYSEHYTHNDFLQLLAESGVTGFGLLVWLMVCAARGAASAAFRERWLGRALLASGVGLAVHGVLNLPLHIAPTVLLFWLALGLISRFRPAPRPAGRTAFALPVPVSRVLASLAVIFVSALGMLIFSASAYTRLGKDRMNRSEWLLAQRAFEKSMRLNWDDRREAFFAGSMRFQQGDALAAAQLLRRETERNPYYMDGHANLGSALGVLGDLPAAEDALRRAIELNPAYAEAYANLGVAQLEQGRVAEAGGSFERALFLEPGLSLAQRGLQLIRDRKRGNAP